ncbi:hypothetical protein Bca52824_007528 [Brassica carinata]|uniref:Uncharacterized protein n=1 Tax=Brassica carinata TaxID=52824 RepID=A0A8X7W952_BRACI|nr:hypothetical protein Bca52824_007528 [Brassica carinata]
MSIFWSAIHRLPSAAATTSPISSVSSKRSFKKPQGWRWASDSGESTNSHPFYYTVSCSSVWLTGQSIQWTAIPKAPTSQSSSDPAAAVFSRPPITSEASGSGT